MNDKDNANFIDLNDIHSNRKPICLYCGIIINEITYSGWEGFTNDGKTTQPICIFCNGNSDPPVMLKSSEIH